VEIRPVCDGDAEAITAILREVDDARVLSAAAWLHERRTSTPRERRLQVVAVEGDAVVGVATAALDTWTTAMDKGWCSVAVTEPQRGHGVGSALLDVALAHLGEIGATRATSFNRFSEEGERWATARSWARVLTGPLIAVDPRTVPEPSLPDGIRIGSMRDANLEAAYDAVLEAARDEPRPEPIDSIPYDEFVTEWERPDVDLDASTVAYDGDRIVAFTELRVVGDRAQHGFTGTRRDYRGRGLATVVKSVALRAAAARGVTRVTTSNAEENASMRAVNAKLGFTPIGEHVIFARELN
jgi:GNAT superfamily N-acetyltransferase